MKIKMRNLNLYIFRVSMNISFKILVKMLRIHIYYVYFHIDVRLMARESVTLAPRQNTSF